MKVCQAFSLLTAAMLSLTAVSSSAQESAAASPLEIAVTYSAQRAISSGNNKLLAAGRRDRIAPSFL